MKTELEKRSQKERMKFATESGTKFGTESPRPLAFIAAEIRRDWKNVYFGAVPYLQAMESMSSIAEDYGADTGKSIVLYFLSNAGTWRGPVARHIKAELLAMTKAKGSKI